jgi:hypothetical protein
MVICNLLLMNNQRLFFKWRTFLVPSRLGRSLFYISFERMSNYNLIRGEAFISGECVSVIEDPGFTNVEQVITIQLSSLYDKTVLSFFSRDVSSGSCIC